MSNSKKMAIMNSNPTWWQTLLLTMAWSIVLAIFTWGLTKSSANADSFKKKFEEKADKEYVDKQDIAVKYELKLHVEADDKRWNIIFDDLKEIKENQRLIYNKLIK